MPSLPAVETHHSRENPMKSPSAAYGSTESTPQIISANPSRWSSDGGSASSGDVVEDALIKAGNLLRTSATRSDDAGNAGPDLQARPGGSTSFSFSVFNLMNAIMVSTTNPAPNRNPAPPRKRKSHDLTFPRRQPPCLPFCMTAHTLSRDRVCWDYHFAQKQQARTSS